MQYKITNITDKLPRTHSHYNASVEIKSPKNGMIKLKPTDSIIIMSNKPPFDVILYRNKRLLDVEVESSSRTKKRKPTPKPSIKPIKVSNREITDITNGIELDVNKIPDVTKTVEDSGEPVKEIEQTSKRPVKKVTKKQIK